MHATPGWALREEGGFLASRSPGGDGLGNDVWAEANPLNMEKARLLFGGERFQWLLEDGQDASFLEAVGAQEHERLVEMVHPLGEVPVPAPIPGVQVCRVHSEPALEVWCDVVCSVHGLAPEAALAFFGGLCRGAGSRLFLARKDGQPAATALVFTSKGGAGVFAVATLPGFRRQGLASLLVRTCLREAQACGCPHASLYASPQGLRLYASLGFEPVQELTEYCLEALA